MRRLLLALFVFYTIGLQAQDWSLFPKTGLGIYHRSAENDPLMLMRIDLEEGNLQHVNFFPVNLNDTLCLQNFYESIASGLDSGVEPNNTLISRSGDTSVWYFNANDSLVFLPGVAVGASWMHKNILYECIGTDTISVFGMADSVKHYLMTVPDNPSSGINFHVMSLSKSFGLLAFPPVEWLMAGDALDGLGWMELKGLKTADEAYGHKLPEWNRFIPYTSGDLLTWDYKLTSVMYGEQYFYQTYFIARSTTPESITLNFIQKKETDSGYVILGPYSSTYHKDYWSSLLHPNGNALVFQVIDGSYNETFFIRKPPLYKGLAGDTLLIEIEFSWANNLVFQSSECMLEMYLDGTYYRYKYDAMLGLTFKSAESFDYTTETLIGFHIGDSIWGLTDLTTGISAPERNTLQVYPNPARQYLYVSGMENTRFQWQIFNMLGSCVLAGEQIGNAIETEQLPAGSYLLRIAHTGTAFFNKE